MTALLLFAVVAAGGADPPKKLAALADKHPTPAVEKKRLDRKLARLVGRPPPQIINLRNIWTNETLVVPTDARAPMPPGTLNSFFRCHFTNQPAHMDGRLLGVVIGAAVRFKAARVDIVSGFRAPKYNLMLRKKGHEVARDSQHTRGNAVDFRIPGVPTPTLLGYVRRLHVGGAGFYPDSQFVHADTGPIRFWTGR